MSKIAKFWMVKGAGPTNAVHRSEASAQDEAQRLARLHPGTSFFVLEAVSLHRKVDVESIDLRDMDEDDQTPF